MGAAASQIEEKGGAEEHEKIVYIRVPGKRWGWRSVPFLPETLLPPEEWASLAEYATGWGVSVHQLHVLWRRVCSPSDSSLGTTSLKLFLRELDAPHRPLLRRLLVNRADEHDRLTFENLAHFLLEFAGLDYAGLLSSCLGSLREGWEGLNLTAVRAVIRHWHAMGQKDGVDGLSPLLRTILAHLHSADPDAFHSPAALLHLGVRYPALIYPLLLAQRAVQNLVGGGPRAWHAAAARKGTALLPYPFTRVAATALTCRVALLECASTGAIPFRFGSKRTVRVWQRDGYGGGMWAPVATARAPRPKAAPSAAEDAQERATEEALVSRLAVEGQDGYRPTSTARHTPGRSVRFLDSSPGKEGEGVAPAVEAPVKPILSPIEQWAASEGIEGADASTPAAEAQSGPEGQTAEEGEEEGRRSRRPRMRGRRASLTAPAPPPAASTLFTESQPVIAPEPKPGARRASYDATLRAAIEAEKATLEATTEAIRVVPVKRRTAFGVVGGDGDDADDWGEAATRKRAEALSEAKQVVRNQTRAQKDRARGRRNSAVVGGEGRWEEAAAEPSAAVLANGRRSSGGAAPAPESGYNYAYEPYFGEGETSAPPMLSTSGSIKSPDRRGSLPTDAASLARNAAAREAFESRPLDMDRGALTPQAKERKARAGALTVALPVLGPAPGPLKSAEPLLLFPGPLPKAAAAARRASMPSLLFRGAAPPAAVVTAGGPDLSGTVVVHELSPPVLLNVPLDGAGDGEVPASADSATVFLAPPLIFASASSVVESAKRGALLPMAMEAGEGGYTEIDTRVRGAAVGFSRGMGLTGGAGKGAHVSHVLPLPRPPKVTPYLAAHPMHVRFDLSSYAIARLVLAHAAAYPDGGRSRRGMAEPCLVCGAARGAAAEAAADEEEDEEGEWEESQWDEGGVDADVRRARGRRRRQAAADAAAAAAAGGDGYVRTDDAGEVPTASRPPAAVARKNRRVAAGAALAAIRAKEAHIIARAATVKQSMRDLLGGQGGQGTGGEGVDDMLHVVSTPRDANTSAREGATATFAFEDEAENAAVTAIGSPVQLVLPTRPTAVPVKPTVGAGSKAAAAKAGVTQATVPHGEAAAPAPSAPLPPRPSPGLCPACTIAVARVAADTLGYALATRLAECGAAVTASVGGVPAATTAIDPPVLRLLDLESGALFDHDLADGSSAWVDAPVSKAQAGRDGEE